MTARFATLEDLRALGVFAGDRRTGMTHEAVASFVAEVEREAELLRLDHALFGRAVTKAGRRVPPEEWGRWEWPPMRLVWESGARRRGSDVGSVGVSSRWPDPLSFIGRAANEGT